MVGPRSVNFTCFVMQVSQKNVLSRRVKMRRYIDEKMVNSNYFDHIICQQNLTDCNQVCDIYARM